jgi:serine/threonine-protein kinase
VAFDVGFDEVFRVQVDGGPRLPLAENAMDPRWALNDTIVYLSRDGGLYRVGPSGGAPTLLLARTDSGPDPCRGELLPNGRGLVFSTCGSIEESQLLVLEIETGEVRELGLLGISPHYVPTGHLVFGHSDQALMGVPFDLETLQTTGPPVTLLPEMDVYGAGALGEQFAVSENGTLIYASGGQTSSPSLRTLVWVDRQGGEEPIAAPPRPYAYPRVSPDARRVAIDTQGETGGILVWDFAAETLTRQGLGDADLTIYPTWTADGEHIAYSTGDSVVYWKRSNNTGSLEALVNVETTAQVRPYFLTADETAVVVRRQTADSPDDLVMISLANDSLVWSLDGAYSELNADLSPDGRLMAYQSDETGRFEVYVRPFPQVATDQIAISNNGGRDPLWSPAGRELFYLEDYEGGTRLMVVSFETSGSEGAFTFRGREVVMEWPYFTGRVGRNYDVSSDGQRFIAITQGRGGELSDQRIYLVTNWFSELCERMGGC